MFLKPTLLTTFSLLTLATAHFRITYPPDRGASDENQSVAPCGGLSPSSKREEWPLSGGRIEFEAGHDEAYTEVRLYVGDAAPTKDKDFNILLVPVFNQIGLGTFCWDKVSVPNGIEGVKDGAKATLVVRQSGHSGGWLYNCADIVFTANPPALTSQCKNGTGIDAEPAPDSVKDTTDDDSGSDSNTTDTGSGNEDKGAAGLTATTAIGGVFGAVVIAIVGGLF